MLEKYDKTAMISFGICFTGMILFFNKAYGGGYTGALANICDNNIKIYVFAVILFFSGYIAMNKIISLVIQKFGSEESGLRKKEIPFWTQVIISIALALVGMAFYIHWGLVDQFEEVGVSNGTFYDFPMLFRAGLMVAFFVWICIIFMKAQDI